MRRERVWQTARISIGRRYFWRACLLLVFGTSFVLLNGFARPLIIVEFYGILSGF